MGKPIWLKNPHLRARLAESLECLLPHHQNQVDHPLACFVMKMHLMFSRKCAQIPTLWKISQKFGKLSFPENVRALWMFLLQTFS
jgi:hypothetical protein